MEKNYNWGIVGTGLIAHEMGNVLTKSGRKVYAVCHIKRDKAEAYGNEYQVGKVFYNIDEMLKDEKLDIVYIAVPHNLHYEMIIKALKAGKHVLCEKVITVNNIQLEEAVQIANERKLVLMEGMTIYHMPLFKEVKKRIDSGIIGRVKLVQVNFGSCKEYDVTNRFFAKELAGGALLDIGVYAVSFARYFLDGKPDNILTTAQYFETGVDEESGIIMQNEQGQMVVTALTMRAKQPKRGVVAGEKGYIEIDNYPRADKAVITYTRDGSHEVISMGETGNALLYEIEDMEKSIMCDKDNTYLNYSRDVTSLLTEIRQQWGFQYPFE